MDNDNSMLIISWKDYIDNTINLAQQIMLNLDNRKKYNIVAIGRGGLIPATIISHKIKIPKIINFGINSYKNQKQNDNVNVYQTIDESVFENEIIVIDDLIDSGKTLDFIRKHIIERAIFGVVYNKIYNNDLKERMNILSSCEINFPCWIKFPYEY